MHALVSALAYGFVLEMVPDLREASLPEVEIMFAELAEVKEEEKAQRRKEKRRAARSQV